MSEGRSAHDVARICFDDHLSVVQAMQSDEFLHGVAAVGDALVDAYRNERKAIFFGNGGSAADSMHLAAEFLGRFLVDRRPAAALALADNHSAITAIGNDYGYEQVFARQIEGLAVRGDVALGFSTSGTSRNVLLGLEAARRLGAVTVIFTGEGGPPADAEIDHVIAIPTRATPRVQEGHMLVGHSLCEYVEEALLVHR